MHPCDIISEGREQSSGQQHQKKSKNCKVQNKKQKMEGDLVNRLMGFCSEISYCNERLQLLGSASMKVINIMKTNHPDSDHGDLNKLEAYAMKAVKCGGYIIDDKRRARRCNWWNRGYCREGTSCPYSHQAEDCREHVEGGCKVQGCSLRHRRRCKHWASAAGCYRRDQCQYLHSEENHEVEIQGTLEQENGSKKIDTTIKGLEAKIEKLVVESKEGKENKVQLEKYKSLSVKLLERGKSVDEENKKLHVKIKENQKFLDKHKNLNRSDKQIQTENITAAKIYHVKISDKAIVVTFKRTELDDEQWEEIKYHAEQSGMDLEEFLDQLGKVVEGYVIRDNEKSSILKK